MLTLDNFLTTVTFTNFCYYWHDKYTIDKARLLHWQLVHGEIPGGYSVSRRCDTGNCVRAGHMYLARDLFPTNYLQRLALTKEERENARKLTQTEREQEQKEAAECQARHLSASNAQDIPRNKGRGKARQFSDDEIRSIRKRFKKKHPINGGKAMALEFDVTAQVIHHIVNRRSYVNVPDIAPVDA